MKQYCVAYIGIITILAESEKEARGQFAREMAEVGDWSEIKEIDYVCEAPEP